MHLLPHALKFKQTISARFEIPISSPTISHKSSHFSFVSVSAVALLLASYDKRCFPQEDRNFEYKYTFAKPRKISFELKPTLN